MADDLLKLKWNGHIASFLEVFQSLRSKSRYTDVTLACEGRLFTVHRLVLASCSQFFDHIFEQTPSENTVIVLNEAKAHDVEALLDYMYCGQVDVQQSELSSFIKTAKCLQIKGLASPDDEDSVTDDRRSLETPPGKRRKNICSSPISTPSHKSSNGSISSNRSNNDTFPKSSNANSISKCWGFQQSDLPNTIWSTSPHSKNDDGGIEKENSAPHQEYIDNTINLSNKSLVIDEIPSRYSPHTQPLSSFRYSPNNSVVSLDVSPSYNSHTKDDSIRRNKFSLQSPDCSDEPIDFKKEIKAEDKSNVDFESQESSVEYDSVNYSVNSDFEHSSEVAENYSHQYSDSTTAYENQPFMVPSRMTTHERPILPLKFVKKVVPMALPSQAWRNCPTNTKSASEQDTCVTRVISSGSNQSTVSPKLLPYAKCSNCQTNNTKLWRRSVQGEIVCNACGLYYKLHGVNRPSHLFRNAPMTRRRNPRKKKRSYEEIVDCREQQHCPEELNDSLYSESGCDSDTQEGLAMLNAALTLNSLLAKAKAQEAANKNVELQNSQTSSAVGCDSSSATNESLPPPPPLLKISLQSVSNGATHDSPASSKVAVVNHTIVKSIDPNSKNSSVDRASTLDSEQQGAGYENVYLKSALT